MSSIPTKTGLARVIKVQDRSLKPFLRKGGLQYDFSSAKRLKSEASTSNQHELVIEDSGRATHGINISKVSTLTSSQQTQSVINSDREPQETPDISEVEHAVDLSTISCKREQSLSGEQSYYNQVINQRLYMIQRRFIVIADFSMDASACKENSCVTICRRPVQFIGSVKYIYSCQCKPNPNMFTISDVVNQAYTDFQTYECIHTKLACKLWDFYDISNDVELTIDLDENKDLQMMDHLYTENQPMPKFEVYPLFSKKVVAVSDISGQSLAYVGLSGTELQYTLKCSNCRGRNCCHIKDHNDLIMDILTENISKRKNYAPRCLSRQRIEFDREKLPESCNWPLKRKFSTKEDELLIIPKASAYNSCTFCGNKFDEGDVVEKNWVAQSVRVVSKNEIMNGKVYYRPCVGCNNILVYDGKEDGMLNMSSYLVSYDLLRAVMHSFIAGKRPLYTWYKCWVEEMRDSGVPSVDLSYDQLRMAWQHFLNLLKTDDEQFHCPSCMPSTNSVPPVVICDGTSVSFQKRMLGNATNLPIMSTNDTVFQGR